MDAAMTRIAASVAAGTTVKASAGLLIADLASKLRAAAGNPAAINALADQLDQGNAELQAKIVENTVAANEPTPPTP